MQALEDVEAVGVHGCEVLSRLDESITYSPDALALAAVIPAREAHRAAVGAFRSHSGLYVGTRLLKMLPWRLQHLDSAIVLWLERKPARPSLIMLSR